MRVLIVDDVPLARERVRVYLESHPDIDIVAECDTGQAAAREIARLAPDLVFLDVQLPDMSGFDVLRAIPYGQRPLVIFLTAYEEHAVKAFDVSALDYLVKPVDRARFEQSVNRARAAMPGSGSAAGDRPSEASTGTYLSRLAIRDNDRTELVPVADIDYIDIAGHYLCIHVGSNVHLMRGSLRELEAQLDPAAFARIHRSQIVRLDRIRYLLPRRNGDYGLELGDGTVLTLSRSYSPALLERLDVPSAGG
jgi:two-component system LytT family response regulator